MLCGECKKEWKKGKKYFSFSVLLKNETRLALFKDSEKKFQNE
jgi:hypothetical protein